MLTKKKEHVLAENFHVQFSDSSRLNFLVLASLLSAFEICALYQMLLGRRKKRKR